LEFIGKIFEIPENILKKRIDVFSQFFKFQEFLKQSLGVLSKGNRQKILITSALLHNPEVIFFDEPLNGLDANAIFSFQDLTSELSKNGKTIFYCSHLLDMIEKIYLLDMIEKISDKIILLDKGKIVVDSPTLELKKSDGYSNLENLFKNLDKAETEKITFSDIYN